MALRLRIVSDHRHAMGARGSVSFGESGGTIGRSVDNDWVLQDAARFVSSRHARILFRDGAWYLEDTSTNGTYLNDDAEPLPKRTPCELANGDLLRFGDYVVAVAIDSTSERIAEPAPAAGARADLELLEGAASSAKQSLAPQVLGHLDDSLDPRMLFNATPKAAVRGGAPERAALSGSNRMLGGNALDASGGLAVGSAFGQPVVVPFGSRRAESHSEPATTESSDIIAARRMERLQRLAGERPAAQPAAANAGAELRPGLEALCRGAGLDAHALGTESAGQMLQLAGLLLREVVVGLKELDLDQRTQLRRLGVEQPPSEPAAAAGFDLALAGDELLTQLLTSHDSRRRDAVQWMRQMLQGIRQHESQVMSAHREALARLLEQLDPKLLEDRFERSASRNLMGARPSNWELYREFFRSLRESSIDPDGVPHTFAENFANAYRQRS